MDEKQMLKYIEAKVAEHGNQGASELAPLLVAMVEQLFKDPVTGVAPIVVNIGPEAVIEGTKTTYPITTPQLMLDAYIDSANENQEKTRLFVDDKGVLIGFSHIEIDELSITGKVTSTDGEYVVNISKSPDGSYFYHDEKIMAIPQVTQGEIDAYNMLFGAHYNKVENEYRVVIGAIDFALTPAEMIIVNEEFNKASTDGNYTAMWANSISRFIRCAPWFEGFHAFNLHSAFTNSKKCEIIDLHTEMLDVSDLTSTFSGCSRLEQISGIINLTEKARVFEAFKGCNTLRVFKLHNLATDLDLSDCPMLAYEVFEEMITYSTMESIKIYVHPTVKNNIDSNPRWADVKEAIDRSLNIQVLTK